MDEIKIKQQVVEKIKEADKILVTVSDDPSVDALSAAIALTMMLDKQQKYATAIFSGNTPPAIAFLEPEKTFDDTTDSLRDFIIALNKEKADHLSYKVVGDSVKIFITPYKTTINEDDLIFSQGDYNVELVIALGVDHQDNLDEALDNHGQILHDATIITMTAGEQTSTLGGIDWHDAESSSLSEMVAGLAEAMKVDKNTALLDAPIATALLTGIVAETDRFSNERTTSKVMTVAASLMAAGADQQLIATELQNGHELSAASADAPSNSNTASTNNEAAEQAASDSTMLAVDHSGETLADLDERVLGKEKAQQKIEEERQGATGSQASDTAQAPEATQPQAESAPSSVPHSAYALPDDAVAPEPAPADASATTEEATSEANKSTENDQNTTGPSRAYLGDTPAPADASATGTFPGAPAVPPGSVGVNGFGGTDSAPQNAYALPDEPVPAPAPEPAPTPAPEPAPDPTQTPPQGLVGGERVIQPLSAQPEPAPVPIAPPAPAPGPAELGLPLPPPLPDFSQGGTPPPALPLPDAPAQPGILGDILAPEAPTAAPFTAPVAPATPVVDTTIAAPIVPEMPAAPAPVPVAADPGQFQIPGQPQ